MHDARTLENAVRLSGPLLLRFLAGFDETNRTAQAPGLPNHAAWTLGHLALTMQRAADLVSGFSEPQRLPTSDWVHGDGTAGDPSRFDTESVCFGSRPVNEPARYPRLSRAREIFEASLDRLAEEVGGASGSALEREVKWGKATLPTGDLVHRVVFHNGTHAGQLIDLRRALGLAPVLG